MAHKFEILYTFPNLQTSAFGLAVLGSDIYFTATDNVVRKLTGGRGVTINTVVAGIEGVSGNKDGEGAMFMDLRGIAVRDDGSLVVASNHKIRKISPLGLVSTLAGNGQEGCANGANAMFAFPQSMAVRADNSIVVADMFNNRIRLISPDGLVTTLAGMMCGFADGSAAEARFKSPTAVAVCPDGDVLVCDWDNNRIRRIAADGTVSTVAGSRAFGHLDGTGRAATFDHPNSIAVDTNGNAVVGEFGGTIRKIVLATGEVTTIVHDLNGNVEALAIDQNSNIVLSFRGSARNATISRLSGSLGIGPGFRSARLPLWKPTRQMMMQSPVWTRDCVIVIMLISERVRRSQGTSQGTNLPSLPNEMWFAILRTMPSSQIGVSPIPRPIGDPPEAPDDDYSFPRLE